MGLVETPSTRAVRAANVAPALRERAEASAPQKAVYAASGAVEHLPLWFEDPYEEKETDDSAVAYVSQDFYRSWLAGGRFALNTIFFPVSAVIRPPWEVMESDGVPSRRVVCWKHDAE